MQCDATQSGQKQLAQGGAIVDIQPLGRGDECAYVGLPRQQAGLQEADLRVIRRGKALEYYSRHYGKVYIERGREGEFTVKDALVLCQS